MHRVHWEVTEYIMFIGSQLAWTEQPKRGVAYRKTEGNGLLLERIWSKRGPIDQEGCGVLQNGGNGLVLERLWSKRGPVHREGCGIPQNGTPRATVHPPSTSSSLHLLLFIHRRLPPASTAYCSSSPPLGPIHPASTGYCSTSPPRGPIQTALHGVPPPATVHPPPPP